MSHVSRGSSWQEVTASHHSPAVTSVWSVTSSTVMMILSTAEADRVHCSGESSKMRREQGAESREQRVGSREQGLESREQVVTLLLEPRHWAEQVGSSGPHWLTAWEILPGGVWPESPANTTEINISIRLKQRSLQNINWNMSTWRVRGACHGGKGRNRSIRLKIIVTSYRVSFLLTSLRTFTSSVKTYDSTDQLDNFPWQSWQMLSSLSDWTHHNNLYLAACHPFIETLGPTSTTTSHQWMGSEAAWLVMNGNEFLSPEEKVRWGPRWVMEEMRNLKTCRTIHA